MKRLHEWGGTPSRRSQKLRKQVRKMLTAGNTPAAILHEIRTSDCSRTEQDRLLRELGISISLSEM